MQTLSFDVRGMTCGRCTGGVQRALGKLDGVSHAEVSLHPGIATVAADPTRVTPAQIESAIAKLGNAAKVRPVQHSEKARREQEKSKGQAQQGEAYGERSRSRGIG